MVLPVIGAAITAEEAFQVFANLVKIASSDGGLAVLARLFSEGNLTLDRVVAANQEITPTPPPVVISEEKAASPSSPPPGV